MVIQISQLYSQVRRTLLETEDAATAGMTARLLLCHVTGKTKEQFLADQQMYVSDDVCAATQALVIPISGTRSLNEAIVTRGGVSVKEIDPSTMESRLVKGLYVAGELLDVDALTGGFNLQIAFSTGLLAGRSAAQAE